MQARLYRFEWDEGKASANFLKHHVSFELASTIFQDSLLLTVPDLEHSDIEPRWFSVGLAATGVALSVVYLWTETALETRVRIISARPATKREVQQYQEES